MGRTPIVLAACALVVGCHTITEELPTEPGPIIVEGGQPLQPPPAPVIVIPVPEATPPPVANEPPRNPAPPTNNNPAPPPPGGYPPGQVPSNTNPAVRLGAKVFFVECDGRPIPNSEHAPSAPVGCRIHYDVTPKDAHNAHTQVREVPRWTFSPAGIAGGAGNVTNFTPTISATGAGTLIAYCEADGIRSNDVRITFH